MKISAALIAFGIAVLLAAELAVVGALRIVAVLLLAAGAIGTGVGAGFGVGAAAVLARVAAPFSRATVVLVAVLFALPVSVVLCAVVAGAGIAFAAGAPTSGNALLLGGGLLATIFLAGVLVALILGVRAIRKREQESQPDTPS